jgi:hypothetical protein
MAEETINMTEVYIKNFDGWNWCARTKAIKIFDIVDINSLAVVDAISPMG